MAASGRVILCSFCAARLEDVRLMFRSKIGGAPACICNDCITEGAALVLRETVPIEPPLEE